MHKPRPQSYLKNNTFDTVFWAYLLSRSFSIYLPNATKIFFMEIKKIMVLLYSYCKCNLMSQETASVMPF